MKPKKDEFVSDGCSLWPDGNYGECCVEHDKAYFKGGTADDRFKADLGLMWCVMSKGKWITAIIMFIGVRTFGGPLFPTSFRWGFGRPYTQSYTYKKQVENDTDPL